MSYQPKVPIDNENGLLSIRHPLAVIQGDNSQEVFFRGDDDRIYMFSDIPDNWPRYSFAVFDTDKEVRKAIAKCLTEGWELIQSDEDFYKEEKQCQQD